MMLYPKVKQTLHDLSKIKDLGEARYFLGIEITRNGQGFCITQKVYTRYAEGQGSYTVNQRLLPWKLHLKSSMMIQSC